MIFPHGSTHPHTALSPHYLTCLHLHHPPHHPVFNAGPWQQWCSNHGRSWLDQLFCFIFYPRHSSHHQHLRNYWEDKWPMDWTQNHTLPQLCWNKLCFDNWRMEWRIKWVLSIHLWLTCQQPMPPPYLLLLTLISAPLCWVEPLHCIILFSTWSQYFLLWCSV